MTRKLECVRADEHGQVQPATEELCKHAMKPPAEVICNEDNPCSGKRVQTHPRCIHITLRYDIYPTYCMLFMT